MKKDSSASVPLDREYLDKALCAQQEHLDKAINAQQEYLDKALREQSMQMFKYIQDVDQRINDRLDSDIGRLDERLDRIEQILDASAGDYKALVAEQAAEISAHNRFDDALADHETRIVQLETPNLEIQAA